MRSRRLRGKQLFGKVSRAVAGTADGAGICSMPQFFSGPRDWRLPRACMALRIFSALRGCGESLESSLPEDAA